MDINKEKFKTQIESGVTVKELQEVYNCSRSTIMKLKKDFGFTGLSPNSKRLDRTAGFKICSSCNTNLPFTDFYSNGTTPLGNIKYKPSCISCTNSSRYSSFFQLIQEYLDTKELKYSCASCSITGPSGFLEFHHKNPEEKSFNIGSYSKSVSLDTFIQDVIPELEKCKLLCPNCHKLEHLLMGPK